MVNSLFAYLHIIFKIEKNRNPYLSIFYFLSYVSELKEKHVLFLESSSNFVSISSLISNQHERNPFKHLKFSILANNSCLFWSWPCSMQLRLPSGRKEVQLHDELDRWNLSESALPHAFVLCRILKKTAIFHVFLSSFSTSHFQCH